MAKVTCAISGLRFSCDYLSCLNITNEAGYMHPVFAASTPTLQALYSKHCKGELDNRDSFLLFLALLHSTEHITWKQPAKLEPNSLQARQLVENNIAQLLRAVAKTDHIRHPSFSQPSFTVSEDTCTLRGIPDWIKSWHRNIDYFYSDKASEKEQQAMQTLENKLSKLILSGEEPVKFAATIAKWADKVSDFPPDKSKLWQETIRSCFSITKMFNTPLPLLKEIKEHCELNIEVGSIHFHTLAKVIREGIHKHVDYLGGSSLALSYTLLEPLSPATSLADKARRERELKGEAEIKVIASNAPTRYPKKEDYSSSLDFLKAKLAYRVASIVVAQQEPKPDTNEKEQTTNEH